MDTDSYEYMEYRAFNVLPSDINQFLKKYIQVNEEEIDHIKTIDQRSDEWLRARMMRITASDFGAAAGHDGKKSQETLLWKKLEFIDSLENQNPQTPKPENIAMLNGVYNEPHAFFDSYCLLKKKYEFTKSYRSFCMDTVGLWIYKEKPFLAASLDGYFIAIDHHDKMITGNLEIKCPFHGNFYSETPVKYYDQFQGASLISGTQIIEFVEWTIERMRVKTYTPNAEYCQSLFKTIEEWYMEKFIPSVILYERGLVDVKAKCFKV